MNKVALYGRLVKDPEIRYTNSQMAVATFTVAVDRDMTKEKKEQAKANHQPTADFIRCKAFGKTAETLGRYLGKGNRIVLTGRIQTGQYQNQQGQTVYTTDVLTERFFFVDSLQRNSYPQPPQNYPQPQSGYTNATPHIEPNPQGYQAPPQDQQMAVDDLPEGFAYIDEDDVPF